jgi:1-acyl-sn-glycerol-3-phosphate acyltransferase
VGGVRDAEALVTVRQDLRRVARTAGFGVLTATMVPGFLARASFAPTEDREGIRTRWVGAWCSALLAMFGIRVTVEGPMPAAGVGHLVVANHRSTADILILLRTFGGRMVSRKDLASWPLVGIAARVAGTVFVDRADAASGATAVRTIEHWLAERSTVIAFPEGTTFSGDDVRPFRPGTFVAAIRSGADIVPVGLAYAKDSEAAFVGESFPAHLARMAAADPSRVAMCVGRAIAVDPKARAAPLRDRAREEVERLVDDARRLVDGR